MHSCLTMSSCGMGALGEFLYFPQQQEGRVPTISVRQRPWSLASNSPGKQTLVGTVISLSSFKQIHLHLSLNKLVCLNKLPRGMPVRFLCSGQPPVGNVRRANDTVETEQMGRQGQRAKLRKRWGEHLGQASSPSLMILVHSLCYM